MYLHVGLLKQEPVQIRLNVAGAGNPSCGDHAMLQPLLLAISLLGPGGLLSLHRCACFGADPGAIRAPSEHRLGELDRESHLEE